MKSYRFNISEDQSQATLTVKADDEQSAIQQAQQLLKQTDQLGDPEEINSQESSAQTQS